MPTSCQYTGVSILICLVLMFVPGADRSAAAACQHPERGRDIRIGAQVAIAVEVGASWCTVATAVAPQAGEVGRDIRVGAQVAVAIEVGAAADAGVGGSRG